MAENPTYSTYKVHNLHGLVVTVRLTRPLRARVWLSMQLMRLATRILGAEWEEEQA